MSKLSKIAVGMAMLSQAVEFDKVYMRNTGNFGMCSSGTTGKANKKKKAERNRTKQSRKKNRRR